MTSEDNLKLWILRLLNKYFLIIVLKNNLIVFFSFLRDYVFNVPETNSSNIIYGLSSRKDNTQCNINVHRSTFYPRVVILCTYMFIMLYILDYLKHRNCFNHQMLMYKSCHQRRQARVNQLKREDQYNLQICEYVSYNSVPDSYRIF